MYCTASNDGRGQSDSGNREAHHANAEFDADSVVLTTRHPSCTAGDFCYPNHLPGCADQVSRWGEGGPVEEATFQYILSGLGLQVVEKGTLCDATFAISMTVEALGATYFGAPRDLCYTGAEVNGQMTLDLADHAPLILRVHCKKEPTSGTIQNCPYESTDPAYDAALAEPVLDNLTALWGHQIYVLAIESEYEGIGQYVSGDKNSSIRRRAIYELGEIGPDAMEAVPVLIQALGDKQTALRTLANHALIKITGRNFGEDSAAWQLWWDQR